MTRAVALCASEQPGELRNPSEVGTKIAGPKWLGGAETASVRRRSPPRERASRERVPLQLIHSALTTAPSVVRKSHATPPDPLGAPASSAPREALKGARKAIIQVVVVTRPILKRPPTASRDAALAGKTTPLRMALRPMPDADVCPSSQSEASAGVSRGPRP
eukprot:CAMPEP_0179908980 /NCGR_PEP_ID=MMETSP0982-20121206/44953_1 /TAXON_ID=483367 /ORGANISM="non described non described, Strain CCMP 2436" /LENGTH=161 /DNA_ID=CAMNT_0021810363 /DNA_START=208 /DNA_END=693 /DNA_ORIENTATION=+